MTNEIPITILRATAAVIFKLNCGLLQSLADIPARGHWSRPEKEILSQSRGQDVNTNEEEYIFIFLSISKGRFPLQNLICNQL
jgi:hypothetical protein